MTSPEDVASRVATLDAASLLPPRRAAAASPGDVVLRDALELGGGLMLGVFTFGSGFLVAPLVIRGAGPARRAEPGDGAFERLLGRLAAGEPEGRFSFVPTGAVPEVSGERAIDVDQSNESVVVGERVVVKLFPSTSAGGGSGSDLPVHLTSVGFTSIPSPFGTVLWRDDEGQRTVVATAAAYLPGARDGWAWYLDLLLGWLDGEVDDAAAFGPAPVLGRIAAEMHAALATPSVVVPSPTGVADEALADEWRRAAIAVADDAVAVTDGDEGARLATRVGAIRAELDRIGEAAGVVTTLVHGDFHVGQVLEWQGGSAVTDFDGDPMSAAAEGGALDTPVRDVAAFVRSIDHLGRVASKRRPERVDTVETWISSSRARFLDAYRAELARCGESVLFAERLLRPLEVAQECHEYLYAARFLPQWRYVPDLAMRAMFPDEDR